MMKIHLATMASIVFAATMFTAVGHAEKVTQEGDILASEVTSQGLSNWIGEMNEKPSSVAIFATKAKAGVDADYPELLENRVLGGLKENTDLKVVQCFECRSLQLQMLDDRLVVKKGIVDAKTLQSLGGKLGVETVLVMDVYKTKLALFTQAMLYDVGSGELRASTLIRAPTLGWYESAMLIMFSGGPVVLGGGNVSSVPEDTFGAGFNLMVLEEIGFGKGGLGAHAIAHPTKGYLTMIGPVLAWRGYYKGSNIYSLKSIELGLGDTNGAKGIGGRVAYDVFIGSFTNVGLSFAGVSANSKESDKPINFAVGLHAGFNFGF